MAQKAVFTFLQSLILPTKAMVKAWLYIMAKKVKKKSACFKWMYGLFDIDYRIHTHSYLTVKGIIILRCLN